MGKKERKEESEDWKKEVQAMWRLKCGKARAVEIKCGAVREKGKKMKGGKMFLRVE